MIFTKRLKLKNISSICHTIIFCLPALISIAYPKKFLLIFLFSIPVFNHFNKKKIPFLLKKIIEETNKEDLSMHAFIGNKKVFSIGPLECESFDKLIETFKIGKAKKEILNLEKEKNLNLVCNIEQLSSSTCLLIIKKIPISGFKKSILLARVTHLTDKIVISQICDEQNCCFVIVEKQTANIVHANKYFTSIFSLSSGQKLEKIISKEELQDIMQKPITIFIMESEASVVCHKIKYKVIDNKKIEELYLTISIKNKYKNNYENLTSPVLEFFIDGQIQSTNTAFKMLFKNNAKKRIDNIYEIFSIKGIAGSMRDLLKRQNNNPNKLTFEITTPLNPNFAGLLSLNNSVRETKEYFTGIITDITEYKKLELHTGHSQKMQAIGELAGGIAHDFNNIMTAILGFCDLLLIQHSASSPSFESIEQIKQNAIRAARLVKQLLAFSKKQIMQPKIIDATENLLELTNNLIKRLVGDNIKIILSLDVEQWPIKIDPAKFDQAIINLAINARDAMQDAGVLKIKTSNIIIKNNHFHLNDKEIYKIGEEQIKNGEYILINIGDNGCGIEKDKIYQIFEPFFSTKKTKGTGLGLSTVYGIIKQSNGHIFISTKKNQGTDFYILLEKADEKAIINKKVKDSAIEVHDLTGKENILIVEDELPVRLFCTKALQNKGYNVIAKESCQEAIKIAEKQKIDLIISDVLMHEMNGIELIQKIRKIKPKIKVIFMSGYVEESILSNCSKPYSMILKPFTLNQLVMTVRKELNKEEIK